MSSSGKARIACVFLLALAFQTGRASNRTPVRPELWFPVGEHLTYRIYWGVLHVGVTTVTTEWIEENHKLLLAIRIRTRTNRLVESIYPVDDFHECIIEPYNFLPVRTRKRIQEGRHRADEEIVFDHARGVARWRSFRTGKEKKLAIEPNTRDIISFMYFMRSRALAPGERFSARVMADDKIYDLVVQVEGREVLDLPELGRRASLKLEPQASFQGLFVRKGRMWMWVSDDEQRLCTRITARVPVASISIWLSDIRIEKGEAENASDS